MSRKANTAKRMTKELERLKGIAIKHRERVRFNYPTEVKDASDRNDYQYSMDDVTTVHNRNVELRKGTTLSKVRGKVKRRRGPSYAGPSGINVTFLGRV